MLLHMFDSYFRSMNFINLSRNYYFFIGKSNQILSCEMNLFYIRVSFISLTVELFLYFPTH